MQISRQRIRLAIDTAQMTILNDVLTGASPKFWNGVDLQFELGIFRGPELADIGNIDSITVDLKAADSRTGLPLMSKTLGSVDFNQLLTLDDWNAGAESDCHALIQFTHQEANLYLADDQVAFWLVISALTGDAPAHQLVLGATPIDVIEGGEGVAPPASVVTPAYYTAAQSDARYQMTIDLTTINTHLTTLDTSVAAAQATANAALPKAGGTMTGALTITGLSGVLKAASGLVSGSATTSDMPEGSNLYFTNARADARITAQKGAANGLCPLDSSSLIPAAYLPSLAISSTFVVASQSAMLALTAQRGDIAIRTDLNQTFILSTDSPSTLADWKQLLTPASAVTSVNSQTGVVTLTTTNIGEGTNLYYTATRAKADAITALLAGLTTAGGGVITSGDSVLSALGKLEYRTALNDAKVTGADRVKLDGTTAMTGALHFTGTGHAGLQLNNLTDTERAALTAANGMLIYNSTLSQLQFYNGSWITLNTGAGGGASVGAWLNGTGAPSGGDGANGDYYLRTSNGDIYQKSSGSWSVIYSSAASTGFLHADGTVDATGPLKWNIGSHDFTGASLYTNPQFAPPVYNNTIVTNIQSLGQVFDGAIWWNSSVAQLQAYFGTIGNVQTLLTNVNGMTLTGGTLTGQLAFDDAVADQIIFGTNKWKVQAVHSGGTGPGTFSISPHDTAFRPGFQVVHDGTGAAGTTVSLSGSKILGPRVSGWQTATGTATRTTFATSTVTLSQLAERVKALIDDLHATAGHGLIGT